MRCGCPGWAVGGRPHDGRTPDGARDADDRYEQFERVILPMFYQRPDDYVDVMRQTIGLTGSFFNKHRMLQQTEPTSREAQVAAREFKVQGRREE